MHQHFLNGVDPAIVHYGLVGPYDRKGLYSVESVLSKIDLLEVDYDGDLVSLCADRYKTFAKSLVCCTCGLVGTFFAKERGCKIIRSPGQPRREGIRVALENDPYHFNLYAVRSFDPKAPHKRLDVLMTKDHITPKSKGGPDHIDNYRTMCSPCNTKRGNKDIPV